MSVASPITKKNDLIENPDKKDLQSIFNRKSVSIYNPTSINITDMKNNIINQDDKSIRDTSSNSKYQSLKDA
jgi:hypothetical protein